MRAATSGVTFLAMFLIGIVPNFVAAANDARSAAGRPNVLVLLSDDQRFDAVGAFGGSAVKTPNLDRLVARGTSFTRAHIMGSTEPAVCAPSRSMLLTGRSLFRSPVRPPADVPLWPQALGNAGYATFATGKWHNGPASLDRCFADARNVFFGGMVDHLHVPVQDHDPAGKYPKTRQRIGDRFSSELFADTAVQFLDAYKSPRPFLLYVAFTAPHDPRMPPAEYAKQYDANAIRLPENFLLRHPFDNGEMEVRDEKLLPTPRDPDAVKGEIAKYYGMVSHLDAQVGRILDALDKSGRAENTIVVFASDNGLALGSHGLLGKQNLYDHSVRVPLIIAGPGIRAGARSDALCYLLDLFPTICELTGTPVPANGDGRSLALILRGERDAIRESLFFAYRNVQRGVRDERFKLIRYDVAGKRTTQLFDLQNDPAELKDLSAEPSFAEQRRRLEELLTKSETDAGGKTPSAVPPRS